MPTDTLYPASTISSINARDQADGTTNLHGPLIDSSDSTYTHTQHTSADAQVVLGLDSTPSDFGSINTVSYVFRTRHFITRDNDTITLNAKLTHSTLGDFTTSSQIDIYNSGGETSFADQSGGFTLTSTGTNATKAQWDGVYLQFDWAYNKAAQPDGIDIDIAEAEIGIDYNASAGVDQLDFERGTPGVMRGVGRGTN